MTSRDFCFWLQGFLELHDPSQGETTPGDARPKLNVTQVECVKRHLALVFKHEIDPSMGDKKTQDALNKIHNGGLHDPPLMRC